MADRVVAVAIKPVAPVLDVDWATGRVRTDATRRLRTPSDGAALATALRIAAARDAEVLVVAVAGPSADEVLRQAIAEGAARALRVVIGDTDLDERGPEEQWSSDEIAAALADVLGSAEVVVCGDASGDRGSGTVPARLAQLLARPQGLCLRDVAVDGGSILGTRRLDGGRRERLSLEAPCVLSVEAQASAEPRAPLARLLASRDAQVGVRRVDPAAGARRGDAPGAAVGPYRPRASDVAAPTSADPVLRAVELAGSLSRREPPEVLRLGPDDAAEAILERLERWGLR